MMAPAAVLLLLHAAVSAESPAPNVTLFPGVNNVDGRAAYRADKGVVVFLGSFETLQACETACLSFRRGSNLCRSFAWHQADMVDPNPQSFRTLCYGVTDTSFRQRPETNVTSGIVHWPPPRCSSDDDCSLNGRCAAATGKCSCLAAWSGPRCAILNLEPAEKGAGLHAPHSPTNTSSSWGGSVGYDEQSARWQMFAAEMVRSLPPAHSRPDPAALPLRAPAGEQLRYRLLGDQQPRRSCIQ